MEYGLYIIYVSKMFDDRGANVGRGEMELYNTVVGSENFQVTEVIMSPRQVAALKYLEPMVEVWIYQILSPIRWLS